MLRKVKRGIVVATTTLKRKHSYINIAVAFEIPLSLRLLTETFQESLGEDYKVPFPSCI